jgi:molybdopterin synthase catalytic subunit
MRICVLAFARVRELLRASEQTLELSAGSSVNDAWSALVRSCPELEEHSGSTRIARNGRLVSLDAALADGDELAILPPVGGG